MLAKANTTEQGAVGTGRAGHFHVALAVRPDSVRAWSDDEIIDRWLRIYRSKCEKANAERRAQMLADQVETGLSLPSGDSSTYTMIWFFAGIQQNQMPEVSLFETRRRLYAHYTKKNLDPVVVLNKSFPFRLYVFDNT